MDGVHTAHSFVLDSPRRAEQPWDGWLLVIVCVLLGGGLVMIYSASAVTAQWQYGDSLYFVKRQCAFLILGFGLLYTGMQIDYRWYKRAVYPILGITVAMLGYVALAGATAGGATRWIQVAGFTFQPAEWTKIAMVMVLAYSVSKKGEKVRSFSVGLVPHVLLVGFVIGLLMLQPDFGTSVILMTLMFSTLFVAGTRVSWILSAVICAAVGGWQLIISSSYRTKRLMAFLDPWQYEADIGYQLTKSMIAIGNGGIAGQGLGNGHGKLGYVPELETDFIGTAIAEELGFFGVCLIVIVFLLLIWRGARIAMQAVDSFGTFLAFGLTVLFGLQAAINLGVISGALPTKGLTLPFMSYGGSSLLCCMFGIGIMLNISRCSDDEWLRKRARKKLEKEQEQWERKRRRIIERRQKERAVTA